MIGKVLNFLLICFFSLSAALCSTAKGDVWEQQFHQQLQHWLRNERISTIWGCDQQRINLHAALLRFYQYRQYQPAWVDSRGLLPEGESALAIIQQADRQGLEPPAYYDRILDDLVNGMLSIPVADRAMNVERHIKLDMMLTGMILRYAFYLSTGRTDPSIFNFSDKPSAPRHGDLAVQLAAMLDNGQFATFLKQLAPQHAAYRALQKSLQEYREIETAGGWPVIDEGPALKFGDRGPRVAMLRYRLTVSKDAIVDSAKLNDRFDDALATAVMRFQHRHGLKADGVLGAGTLAAMNVPVAQRIRQIELNLERWRWLPPKLETYHIRVNIPSFELKVIDKGQAVKTMRVIVGREERPTPMLSSKMTYLELNPYWQVPSKIAREDLLPKIQKDPKFLVRQNFQVFKGWEEDAHALNPFSIKWATLDKDNFPYRLRQEPSPHNALGQVKFMFPNELSVYIHDTPSKRLFHRSSRDFSSGCVRVEKPLELAAFLLGRQNWNLKRLDEVLAAKKRQVVVLKEPVPVYLVYMTAWAGENGEVHFREDIYGRDQQLQTLLAEIEAAEQRCAAAVLPTYFVQSAPAGGLSAGL